MRIMLIALLVILLIGCYRIPPEIVDSVKMLHASNVVICEDYVEILPLRYQGEALTNKYNFVLKHLELSKELVKAVKKYR